MFVCVQSICGYRRTCCRSALKWALTALTLGIFRLVCYWRPHWLVRVAMTTCGLDRADVVILHVREQDFYFFIFYFIFCLNLNTRYCVPECG